MIAPLTDNEWSILQLYIPGDDNEEIKSVPRITKVSSFAEQTHRDDLDTHLGSEEDEDGVIEAFEDAAAQRRTDDVFARLKHAECYTVEQDHGHADSLEPRAGNYCQGSDTAYTVAWNNTFYYLFSMRTSHLRAHSLALRPIHTADADAAQLSSFVASAVWRIRN